MLGKALGETTHGIPGRICGKTSELSKELLEKLLKRIFKNFPQELLEEFLFRTVNFSQNILKQICLRNFHTKTFFKEFAKVMLMGNGGIVSKGICKVIAEEISKKFAK